MAGKASKRNAAADDRRDPDYSNVYARLDRFILETFPGARHIEAYRMRGWQVDVPPDRIPPRRGTMDPRFLTVFIARRKSGITLHVWDPSDYSRLEKHRTALTRTGFKVMVGCIQFNRRAPYPVEAVEKILQDARDSWKTDGPRL